MSVFIFQLNELMSLINVYSYKNYIKLYNYSYMYTHITKLKCIIIRIA